MRSRIRAEFEQQHLAQDIAKTSVPIEPKDEGFKQPPLLGLITRLFRGIKYDIKNIHIRYEDDIFSEPFSFGFTIKDIKLDTDIELENKLKGTIVKI